jgi:hypothetical protein
MNNLHLRDAATNGRFKAYPMFKYFAEPWVSHSLSDYNIDKLSQFFEIREWCVNTWGASQEFEVWRFFNRAGKTVNQHWCFDVNTTNQPMLRIYFRSAAEYALYKLKWS